MHWLHSRNDSVSAILSPLVWKLKGQKFSMGFFFFFFWGGGGGGANVGSRDFFWELFGS